VGDGRDEHGHRDLLAEDGGRRAGLRDVDEDARSYEPAPESCDVRGKRELVGGAAGVVGERRRVETLGGGLFVVENVEELQAT
jgi:hypothetical protein